MSKLIIKNLFAKVEGKEVLKGVNLEINSGEVHALMGPNGSGKSTLANLLMGKPNVQMTEGEILFDGKKLNEMTPEQRSQAGLFLGFQHSQAIPGVSVMNMLRLVRNNHDKSKGKGTMKVTDLVTMLKKYLVKLALPAETLDRYLNDGFSGGEKKKAEILQLMVLEPSIAVLDEADSGVDIDSLKIIGNAVSDMVGSEKLGVLLITHYPRLLHYVKPNKVHVFINGKIVQTGGPELALKLEKEGYKEYLPKTGLKVIKSKKSSYAPTPRELLK